MPNESSVRYRPARGHLVRVTVEGKVNFVGGTGLFDVSYPGGENTFDPNAVTVERLPDPEPEWQIGDVVRSKGDELWFRIGDGWRAIGTGVRVDDDWPVRPLTLLVRGSKAVQA